MRCIHLVIINVHNKVVKNCSGVVVDLLIIKTSNLVSSTFTPLPNVAILNLQGSHLVTYPNEKLLHIKKV